MNVPDIKPEWRTSTVVAICQSMRETADYSALPILADALQDAGRPEDFPILTELRGGTLAGTNAERMVACVISDEGRAAVKWLDGFAEQLGDNYRYDDEDGSAPSQPMNYGVLMETADEYVRTGETLTQYDGDNWRDEMYGDNRFKFWACFQVVTGRTYSKEPDRWGYEPSGAIFSCSC